MISLSYFAFSLESGTAVLFFSIFFWDLAIKFHVLIDFFYNTFLELYRAHGHLLI